SGRAGGCPRSRAVRRGGGGGGRGASRACCVPCRAVVPHPPVAFHGAGRVADQVAPAIADQHAARSRVRLYQRAFQPAAAEVLFGRDDGLLAFIARVALPDGPVRRPRPRSLAGPVPAVVVLAGLAHEAPFLSGTYGAWTAGPGQVVPGDRGPGGARWRQVRDLPPEEAADGLAAGVQARDQVAAARHQRLIGVAQRAFEDAVAVVDGLVHDGAVHRVNIGQRA